MGQTQRTGFCILRNGRRRCRGSRGIGHHYCGVPHAGNFERRPGESSQIMTPNLHLWLIPLLPLIGAAINGFFGRRSSRPAITTVALVFSGAAFATALWVASQFSSL